MQKTLFFLISASILSVSLLSNAASPLSTTRQSSENKLTFARSYKPGDVDKYSFEMKFDGKKLSATFVDTVSKVYGSGEADISEKVSDAMMSVASGQPQPNSENNKEIGFKVSQYGLVIGNMPSTFGGWIIFSFCIPGESAGLQLNGSAHYKRSLNGPSGPEAAPTVDGNVTLVEIVQGIAKLKVSANIALPGTQSGSGTVKGTLLWDIKSSRYSGATLSLENHTSAGTQTAEISIKRLP